ncbi:hypothetical protein HPB49_010615 [Dermacentor silvarum]|uniref:Uncharacterized protein n=1 Tax=Dermacentor silvarum TaxID=543639 RepID=A0ACB8DZC3_DERSI|nr:uncharacterized protein LOC125942742 [Dermacentor silvarum]KAH7979698.1 hypothetical protein HPB49_010615 [Dermacentor silvarum]
MQHLRRSPPTVNIDGQGTATEERLERDDFESRFPELTLPCTAESTGGNDYSSAATCCHVLERLSVWNCVLWHVGLQLRELMAPGELSLVHVSPTGCGFQQQLHGRDARLFFYALLTRHRCVVSVDLDEALVEGSGLGECRKHVVSALRQNTSLQALRLGSLFCNYRFIQEDMLAAITTLPHLQKLVVSVIGAVPPCLVDALRYLLETTSLSTLSISGLIFDEDIARRLLAALRRNHTVADLSVHSSITRSQLPNEVTEFSHYLATSIPLSTLTIEGVHSNPETTRSELRNIVTPLVARGTLLKLRLSGFLLDDDCVYLLSQLVARKGGALQHLDICGCRWRPDASTLCQYAGIDCNQLSPASSKQAYASLHAFDDVAQVQLSFLSLSLAGLTPDDCRALFGATAVIESLKTISISDVALAELPEICRAIRDTGMIGRVRIKDEYLVDSAAICVLWNFREEVCHVAVSSLNESSAARFHETVRLVCSWYHVTTLRLFLSQEAIGDISTMWLLYKYLNGYSTLRELELDRLRQTRPERLPSCRRPGP